MIYLHILWTLNPVFEFWGLNPTLFAQSLLDSINDTLGVRYNPIVDFYYAG